MAETRRLYRSKTDRVLAGVCGGLAQYFNLDATLIRMLFVLLAVLGGAGLVVYVAMWIIVPNQPKAGPARGWSTVAPIRAPEGSVVARDGVVLRR